MKKEPITGVILAGGKSLRMGTDKGLVLLNGKKLIEHVLDAVASVTDNVIIIANSNSYNGYGYPVYEDIIKDCGPMGGIYTALQKSDADKNLILSCDIPFITSPMLSFIISHSFGAEIVVPKHEEKIEPLCAVYSKKCAEKFKQLLEKKEWKMQSALKYFNTKEIEISTIKEIEKNFININTPQELNEQKNNTSCD